MQRSPKLKRNNTVDIIHKQFSANDQKLFDVMIKYFYLSLLTICSTQLFTASEIAASFAVEFAQLYDVYKWYYLSYKWYYVFRATDSIMSMVYILLTFRFTEPWYMKFCKTCHKKCVRIWEKSVKSQVKLKLKVSFDSDSTPANLPGLAPVPSVSPPVSPGVNGNATGGNSGNNGKSSDVNVKVNNAATDNTKIMKKSTADATPISDGVNTEREDRNKVEMHGNMETDSNVENNETGGGKQVPA